MNRRSIGLLTIEILFLLLLLGSCGIDEYIYLEPVTSSTISSSDSQKITVNLPSSQSVYFNEYLIYYRIFPSTTTSVNSVTDSNRSTIINANENYPATLETVLKNLKFKVLGFAKNTQNATIFPLSNPLSSSNINTNSINSFVIDFNLSSLDYPSLIVNDSNGNYRLIRNPDLTLDDKYKDLFYYDSLTYSSMTSSNAQDLDYYPISGYSRSVFSYAHVQLVIVASGHDSSLSTLHSTALVLGVFKLTEVNY